MEKQDKLFDDVLFEEVHQLEEGKYTGTITGIRRDKETYDYTRYDIDVDDDEVDMTLATSFPTRVTFLPDGTPSSQHAKFLKAMGVELKASTNLSTVIGKLKGKKVEFLVVNKETECGTFSIIVKESLKLK